MKLGAQGFGGLGAILTLLTRELVERRGWLRESDITEALTSTKLLPAFAVMLGLAAGYRYLAPLAGVPVPSAG